MHSFQNALGESLSGVKKCTLLSLGGAGGQTIHNRSTFGAPLKTYGHNASNELCGKSVASKLRPQQANGLFYQGDTEIGENLHLFIKRSAPENFQHEFFSMLLLPKVERVAKRDLPAKLRGAPETNFL